MLKVYNVGQGDSFLLKPEGCVFDKIPLLIDTGLSKAKVYQKIPETVKVLITHSHNDHIGGLPAVLKNKQVTEIILPKYLPEVIKIRNFLGKHVQSSLQSPDWRKIKKLPYTYVSQNSYLCGHITVLNPPNQFSDFFPEGSVIQGDIQEALANLEENGINLPKEEIINYETPLPPKESTHENRIREDENLREYSFEARRLVHSFFINLSYSIKDKLSSSLHYEIQRKFELTSNQASIVFKLCLEENAMWLFTGDADDYVFERLVNGNIDISADILKVPHHGSRENLSTETLKLINPKYAIISHANKKFGRSKDTHPHHEVIDRLDRFKVVTYYTNDVVKNKKIIRKATTGPVLNGKIIFS